ncbi:MFS transporter [Rhodococcus olei]|uniref:MFS transporter n=2 Tax=Rhodococcus olei TaxID=2161675 RepID=A0ABP8P8F8_9NOCA
MASLDLFVVNVAFADIAASYPGHTLGALSWVLNGYAIVYAALLVPLGRWADRVGRTRGFVTGLTVFTAASVACAASPSLGWLVACRLLQAAGAAALTPASLGLLIGTAPEARRAAAVRIWAASGAAAAALGPVVGGLLVQASWRWAFLINLPVGVALLVAAIRILPRDARATSEPLPDPLGAALLSIAGGALSLALVQAPDWGWSDPRVLVAFALAAAAVAWFVQRTRTHRTPLIEPDLFRVRSFAWSNAAALTFSATFAAGLLAVVLWLQQVWAYSALATGLAVAPGPLIVPLFAAAGQVLSRRLRAGVVTTIGCLLWVVGTVTILVSVDVSGDYATQLLPGWVVCGMGVGLALPTILSSATAGLPPARSATGSAVVNMSRQIGTVLGVSILIAAFGGDSSPDAFQRGWWLTAVVGLLAAVTAVGMNSRADAS